jgi:hypothetical protein
MLAFMKTLMNESALNKFGWAPNSWEKSSLCGCEKTFADEMNYSSTTGN